MVTSCPWKAQRRIYHGIASSTGRSSLAMLAGTIAGLLGGRDLVPYVGWLGELFVKLLKMVIVPLVFTSIVSGVASVGGGRDLGRLFGKTLGYYVLTSLLAALTGLVLVNAIRPGVGANFTGAESAGAPRARDPVVGHRSAARHRARERLRRRREARHAGGHLLLHPPRDDHRQPAGEAPERPDRALRRRLPGDDEAHRRDHQVRADRRLRPDRAGGRRRPASRRSAPSACTCSRSPPG